MRECRWMCNYYIGGGGRCGLASVHGCTLACMYALLHAGCRTGGLVRTCVCRISKCITRISQCISRAGHAMVPPHSTGLRLAVGWGVPIRKIRHTASWRCEIAGSGGAARMAQLLIAATTRAPARHRRDIVLGAESEYAHTTHHAPIGRASTTLSQPDVSLQKTLHIP